MVIEYEVYKARRRVVSLISYAMTTRVRSSVFIKYLLRKYTEFSFGKENAVLIPLGDIFEYIRFQMFDFRN